MARFKTIQTRFTQGEVDPLMIGRVDVDQYYGAGETLRNVFTLPQGGVKRRPGLEYIGNVLGSITLTTPSNGSAPNGGTPANGWDDSSASTVLTTTDISTTNPYVVLSYDMGSAVSIGVVYIFDLKLTVSGTSSEFYIQVSTDNSTWTTAGDALSISTTGKDFSRRVHGSYRYVRLVRIGATDLTTNRVELDDMLIYVESGVSVSRIVPFEFNVTQTYVMVFSDKNVAIYQNGVYLIDIRTPNFTSARLAEIDWVYSGDTLIVFHPDVQTSTLRRNNANDVWVLGSVTYTNIPTYDFGSGAESIWSSTRGWPRHGAFWQGRLFVDGGRSRPSVLYGSQVNSIYDFNFGTALDDEAIGPLGGNDLNDINHIHPGRDLMVFTTTAEYILPQPFGDPLTPGTAIIKRQTSLGSEAYMRPQETEGGVLYVQRGGKAIQEFIYDEAQSAYANNFVSVFSSHLVEGPADFGLRKATSTEEGAYLLLALDDGTLTVANILRVQGITAFTNQNTDGLFKNCASDVDQMYFVVQRNINGTDVKYLERFNSSCYMDASKLITTGLPAATFAAAHLKNEACRVLADGAVQPNETPNSSTGSFTIDRNAVTSLEIGLNFNPTVKDLPVENVKFGTVMGRLVNISEISLRVSATAHMIVNSRPVSFTETGEDVLDEAPPQFTGVHRMVGWRGWTEGGQVTITQDDPLPMTVLSIAKRVNA